MEVESVLYPDGVPAPQITVCPLHATNKVGWTNAPPIYATHGSFYDMCNTAVNISDCIRDETYQIEEYLLNPDLNITSRITAAKYGNCVSIETDQKLHSKIGDSDIKLKLKKGYEYSIFIYDPNFFFISENPKANPGLKIELSERYTSAISVQYLKIEITEHQKLNLKSKPCVEDDSYNFGHCLEKVIKTKAGCTLPWYLSKDEIYCKTLEEFKLYDEFYTKIMNNELQDIIDKTGCQAPCKFREVKEVGAPTDTAGKPFVTKFTFGPTLVSTTIRKETEKLSTSFETLISNIGGSLGLFLGFSFIVIWDWVEFAIQFLMSLNRK